MEPGCQSDRSGNVRLLGEEPQRRRGRGAPQTRGNHGRNRRAGRRERGGAASHPEVALKLTPSFFDDIRELIAGARTNVARGVDLVQVHTNFEIGRRIVEEEQRGKDRAAYGEEVVRALADRLTGEFGRGFSDTNLKLMRLFYLQNT